MAGHHLIPADPLQDSMHDRPLRSRFAPAPLGLRQRQFDHIRDADVAMEPSVHDEDTAPDDRARFGNAFDGSAPEPEIHGGLALAAGAFEAADEMVPAYDLDIPEITETWRRGSVVASWLLDLTAQALHESKDLNEYSTQVSDSGEGRWTVQAAIEAGVPAHVLSASLYSRFTSRNNDEFANRVLSAMRRKFGGH